MIQIVQQNITNLFDGTDPSYKVLGGILVDRRISITRTMGEKILEAEEAKKRNRELFLTAIAGTQRINHYKKIENLIPTETSTFNRVLASLAQNQLMKDQGFR